MRSPLKPFLIRNDPDAGYDFGVKGSQQLMPVRFNKLKYFFLIKLTDTDFGFFIFPLQEGKQQALEFGEYLRKRYEGYLDSHYNRDEVYTKSSDFDRSILTSQLCLAGLFPVNSECKSDTHDLESLKWEPIPIRTTPPPIDNVSNSVPFLFLAIAEFEY